jgi:hypothetical protein
MIKGSEEDMTRATQKLSDRLTVERIDPRTATTMLVHGLLSSEEAETFRPANVTVESLARLLVTANAARNRKVSMPHVLKLARDMTDGHWYFTGDPVKIDDDDFVIDGQHRLLAIIKSGIAQHLAVLREAARDVQLVTDIGRSRTARDQLTIRGSSNTTNAAAGAKLLLKWRSGSIMNSQYQPTIPEIVMLVESTPELIEACQRVMKIRTQIARAPMSALVAAYVEAGALDVNARDFFFEKLTFGDELPQHHPILTLRNRFGSRGAGTHGTRFRQLGQLYLVVHSWNKWRADEPLRLLRVPSTLNSETFPKMR